MMQLELSHATDFDGWREHARRLAANGVPADAVEWHVRGESASLLGSTALDLPICTPATPIHVPRAFVELARMVVLHSDPQRFALLYRVLLRLRAEPRLLELAIDRDIDRLRHMEHAVQHDMHRMHAYVRFRKVIDADGERFIAWYEPEHHIVEATADFFVRRFAGQRWAILTPKRSAVWDGETLHFAPGVPRSSAPGPDALEHMWRTYYASVFNPARVNRTALQSHMPRKFWQQLPEAQIIAPLIAHATVRAGAMVAAEAAAPRRKRPSPLNPAPDASDADGMDKDTLDRCRRCPLWKHATQGVPGEGPVGASLMLVGEQPGDQEDLTGRPFVGPAGQLLDRALAEAGIDRSRVFVTNAVKHFKYEPRGKRRIHKKPSDSEIEACNVWLQQEIETVGAQLIVALGATAIRALAGRALPVQANRGQVLPLGDGRPMLVTVHPSFLLRVPPENRDAEYAKFVADLRIAARWLRDQGKR